MHELIADMPMDERPRERMLLHGAQTLSDAELVAILLGSGIPGKNAIQLAREMLGEGFASLARCDSDQLARRCGVGRAKASRIVAAFEVARRLSSHKPDAAAEFDADIFGRTLIARCTRFSQERLGALYLNSRGRIIREREIYVGTVNSALVSPRDVVRHALEVNAVGVVLFHNHPSGDPSPSGEDLSYTRKTRDSLKLMDIQLIDHLVAGLHGFTSMKQKGLF